MKTTTYNPGMQITNLDQLPRGTGAKYLEVRDDGSGPFIAVQWRRTQPKNLPSKHILLEFKR
jgi:hypothetical protein